MRETSHVRRVKAVIVMKCMLFFQPSESDVTSESVRGEDEDINKDETRESGGSDSWDVSQLVSMLENQVTRLDKQLE